MGDKSDPICDAVGNDLNAITDSRLETLAASADIQVMARSLLEHEARRIEALSRTDFGRAVRRVRRECELDQQILTELLRVELREQRTEGAVERSPGVRRHRRA